jgi:hypothetical protein
MGRDLERRYQQLLNFCRLGLADGALQFVMLIASSRPYRRNRPVQSRSQQSGDYRELPSQPWHASFDDVQDYLLPTKQRCQTQISTQILIQFKNSTPNEIPHLYRPECEALLYAPRSPLAAPKSPLPLAERGKRERRRTRYKYRNRYVTLKVSLDKGS